MIPFAPDSQFLSQSNPIDKPTPEVRSPESDADWHEFIAEWAIRDDTVYLNHGSFGPTPRSVRAAQQNWHVRLAEQPMDFFLRVLEPAWLQARQRLAEFVGTQVQNLGFVENSTAAMNIVAQSVELTSKDEVLLTDHEYGAVKRIWQRRCSQAGAPEPRWAELPFPIEGVDQVVDAISGQLTDRTRVLIVSHITSPGGIILPVDEICRQARRQGVSVVVDGPHAPAQIDVNLDQLQCDFYTASLHKWLSAPIGSGFLYVAPRHHESVQPTRLSWGRIDPGGPRTWAEELIWPGTRDPSAYLACPAAIELLESVGVEAFRNRTHLLAKYARTVLRDEVGVSAAVPDNARWYGSMTSATLPQGDAPSLQQSLWRNHRIEVPVVDHLGRRSIRVSCHLYNTHAQIDALAAALRAQLRQEQ